jgi:hypothetical protein
MMNKENLEKLRPVRGKSGMKRIGVYIMNLSLVYVVVNVVSPHLS